MTTSRLPSGTVTFVFTDIEGSTRLFRRIGDRYPPLLERHHAILRAAWAAFNGAEVKTEGDAFFVAFGDAADAIRACALAQQKLTAERWPDDAIVRVRMAMHTGLAFPRDDDYVAFAVHQAARVVSAAHGGQIVVSADTARTADIGDEPIGGVGLQSLGRYRVRDFDEPVELFQVTGPGLSQDFPALRALPADKHNLVAPVTSLVGRSAEVDELTDLMSRFRLVSVVGAGGLGKTRLVIEYGLRRSEDWKHGVWFVDLAPISDASAVVAAVFEAVGVPSANQGDAWSAVLEHLRERAAVVILDNCEHVTAEVGVRINALLKACPKVSVLATSREPLGLRSERVWRPEPLPAGTAAVELFCQRAGIDSPDPATNATIGALCARLDGLPLAVELAAARADVLSPAEILARLDGPRDILRSRDPGLDPRQRSLDELIDWSFRLLNIDEQKSMSGHFSPRSSFRRIPVIAASQYNGNSR